MKVTRQMFHEDLRSYPSLLKIIPVLKKSKRMTKFLQYLVEKTNGKEVEGLKCEEAYIPSSDGSYQIRVRIYRPLKSEGTLPAMLYYHGGGYLNGNPEATGFIYKDLIDRRPCVIIAPDYRKAYTKPYPGAFDDCYDTLLWVKDNTATLGVASDKVIIAGHSAGGGLCAAVTLKARDTEDVNVAFQMPIYPMIDDQQPDDPARNIDTLLWNTDTNRVAWNAYLADLKEQGAEIPAYAAPARNTDYSGFPPTITFVGTLEPFYWETVAYAQALKDAGIDVAFEEYQGCFHGFELIKPEADISKRAWKFYFESYESFYDKYVVAA